MDRVITVSLSVYGPGRVGKSTMIRDIERFLEERYTLIVSQQTFSKTGEHWRGRLKRK